MFLSLILPAILCALPFMALFILANLKAIKFSTLRTGLVVLGLALLHFPFSYLAVQLSDAAMASDIPKGKVYCNMGIVLFLMEGALFGLLTVVFGIIYVLRNAGLEKIMETNITKE